mmetsp:Transcript_72845/g.201999  ORF Transcript_72845/g.201999 Transcript_72845/m.201999 type:complete len:203 (+) Transcript_72845:70-678(+)
MFAAGQLEVCMRALVDDHLRDWFAHVERQFVENEARFVAVEERLAKLEGHFLTCSSKDEAFRIKEDIRCINVRIAGEEGLEAQLAGADSRIRQLTEQVHGEHGLAAKLVDLDQLTLKLDHILTGAESPQMQLDSIRTDVSSQFEDLALKIEKKVGRDDLYWEMMAQHMIVPPRSPAASRPLSQSQRWPAPCTPRTPRSPSVH